MDYEKENAAKDIDLSNAVLMNKSDAPEVNSESAGESGVNDIEEYILKRPISFKGETKTRLILNFGDLTAKDLENAERSARRRLDKKESMNVPETSKKYLACVAAKAAGVSVEYIYSLYAQDFTQLALLAQNFLLADSEEEVTLTTEQE